MGFVRGSFGSCSSDRRRSRQKKHLSEAALFGCVNQMLRMTERRRKKAFDQGGPVWPPQSNAEDHQPASKKNNLIEAALFGLLDQMLRTTKHLMEAVPFGRLDQMLRTAIQGGLDSPAKNG